jgi:hypothetical protein
MGVNVGMSGADYPRTTLGLTGFQRQYRLVGEGSFSYPVTQTWIATAIIRRGLEYESNLPTPVVNNGIRLSAAGLLTNRVDIVATASYATGESVLSQNALVYDTYEGDVTVRYAMSRTLAVFGEYLYYYYDIQNGGLLLAGMPRGLRRHGVRVGLTLWMPTLRR